MSIYNEAILWYILAADAIVYNVMAWTQNTFHHKEYHWISAHFPLNRFFGLFYLGLLIWVGFTLHRMQIIF